MTRRPLLWLAWALAAWTALTAWAALAPDDSLGFPGCSALDNARATFWVGVVLSRGLLWPADGGWWLGSVPEAAIFDGLRERYGRACTLRVWGRSLVILTDPADVDRMLRDSPDPLRAGALKSRFFRGLMDGNVGIAHGADWVRRRALTERCMPSPQRIAEAAERAVAALDRRPASFAEFQAAVAVPVTTHLVSGGASLEPLLRALKQTTRNWWRFLLLGQNNLTDAQSADLREHLARLYAEATPGSMVGTLRGLPGGAEALTEIPHWAFPMVGAVALGAYATLRYADVDLARCRTDRRYLTTCVVRTMWRNNPVFSMIRTVGVPEYRVAGRTVPEGTQVGVLVSGWLRSAGSGGDVFSKGPQRCPGKDTAVLLATELCWGLLRRFPDWPPGTLTSEARLDPGSV